MTGNERPQVILRNCDSYDVPAIRDIIRDGLQQMQLHPARPDFVEAEPSFQRGSCSNMPTHALNLPRVFCWPCATKTTAE